MPLLATSWRTWPTMPPSTVWPWSQFISSASLTWGSSAVMRKSDEATAFGLTTLAPTASAASSRLRPQKRTAS
ncbi:hypothetical protein D3C71_1611180 [compost metagenome]